MESNATLSFVNIYYNDDMRSELILDNGPLHRYPFPLTKFHPAVLTMSCHQTCEEIDVRV